jgi:hypothetical protein
MRDFRDAKAMAQTLRAALATRGHKITISESLELIAQAFGVADWNTLSATIRAEAPTPRESASGTRRHLDGFVATALLCRKPGSLALAGAKV